MPWRFLAFAGASPGCCRSGGDIFLFFFSTVLESFSTIAAYEPHVYNSLYFAEQGRAIQNASGELVTGPPSIDLTQYGYPVVYGAVGLIILIASAGAWRAALRQTVSGRGVATSA